MEGRSKAPSRAGSKEIMNNIGKSDHNLRSANLERGSCEPRTLTRVQNVSWPL